MSENREIKEMPGSAEATGKRLGLHPLALIFPELVGDPFDELVESIRASGQREPVLLADDKIADGRNRARAVWKLQDEGLEITLRTEVWDGTKGRSLADEVWDRNACRRHLTEDQLAIAAMELLETVKREAQKRQQESRSTANQKSDPPRKRNVKGQKNENSTRGILAATTRISRHKVDQAMKLSHPGAQHLRDAVKNGEMRLAAACRQLAKKDGGETDPAGKPAKESPSIVQLVTRAWKKLKDQVGCADAAELRAAMRKIIKDDEDSLTGGKKRGSDPPAVVKKRGPGRPPKNPAAGLVADPHVSEPISAHPVIEIKAVVNELVKETGKEAIKCS